MLQGVSVGIGGGSIGFPAIDEEFEACLINHGFDPEESNLPEWLFDSGEDWYIVQDESKFVLLQYTGLKDCNDKEIYEADILKTGTDKLMVVTWNSRFSSFSLEREGWLFSHFFGEACNPVDTQVAGNIFENPDLIREVPNA